MPSLSKGSEKTSLEPFTDVRRGAMIHAPSTRRSSRGSSATNYPERFCYKGVDGQEKRCRMGGSPRTKRLGAVPEKPVPSERSLTVCAGELCGRLVLNGSRPVQAMQASHQEKSQ